MLLPLGKKTLLQHCWDRTVVAFGYDHTIIACPEADLMELRGAAPHARFFGWDGPENDVLGRFYYCAHTCRWHPDTVIIRITPDDPYKDWQAMRRVAAGERLPVEVGAEAFTLAQLDEAHFRIVDASVWREHITLALFVVPPPPAPEGNYTIDTPEQYARVLEEQPDE